MGERSAVIIGVVLGTLISGYLIFYQPMMANYRDHGSVFLSTNGEG